MRSEGESRANRRGEPRVPFDGAVRLRYRLFHEFLEENAANISGGGMFIRTIHPGETGSELDFEIRLDDDFTLIQGRGEVAWVRRPGDEPGAEPGMGIRFIELPDESRALVGKIVKERVAAGLELFDLESHAPAVEPAPAATAASGDGPIWDLEGDTGGGVDAPEAAPPAAEGHAVELAADPVSAGTAAEENLAALDPELPRSPATPDRPLPVAAMPRPRRRVEARRAGPARLVAVAVLSALVGAGAVLTFYWLYVQPSMDALETRIDELAGNPGGPWQPPADEPDEAAAPAPAGAEGETPASSPASRSDEVLDALRGWAAAWTEQRVDDYLACYAAGFRPPDGLDRAAWEASRRARIARPEWIRVALTLVQVDSTGPDTAEVGFVQSYRSERYNDLVKKRMSMVREDGVWKIAAERSLPR